jgi:hypothetical protein
MADMDPIEASAETEAKKAKVPRLAKLEAKGKWTEGFDSRASQGGRPEGFVRKAKAKKCALLIGT